MQDDILAFWFGDPPGAERDVWFRADDAFDATIRARFGGAIETAIAGGYRDWAARPRGALALVLLLDQFTRNAFRGTPRAFAGDAAALATARAAVDQAFDAALAPVERWFLYMPFQHAEERAAQARSVEFFTRLAAEGLPRTLDYAERHAAIIERFGRFPHRNEILGRESTAEEVAFLRQPGSRF